VTSIYDALGAYLRNCTEDRVTLTFDEIESIVGNLAPSARENRTWWGNTVNRTRTQAQAWMAAGWVVAKHGVNLTRGEVTFERKNK